MKKTLIIVVIVIIIAVLAIWLVYRSPEPVSSPAGETAETAEVSGGDTTSVINSDLDSLDLGDLDAEFEQIDADLNQL